jgi:lipopolysaccharide export system permease protein
VEIAGKPDATFLQRDQLWVRSPDSITHAGKLDRTTAALDRITVIRWNANYEFIERLFADKAKWWNNHWMFYGVNRTVQASDGQIVMESIPSMIGPLKKTPMDFDRIEMATKEMNMAQLGDYIDRMTEDGHTPARYLVDWHDKIAFPMVCLIMSALSVPFSIKISPRGGGIAAGLALSLVVAFSYWIGHTLFIALGHGGYIPPVAAAWGANVIFALAAAILLLQAGT